MHLVLAVLVAVVVVVVVVATSLYVSGSIRMEQRAQEDSVVGGMGVVVARMEIRTGTENRRGMMEVSEPQMETEH